MKEAVEQAVEKAEYNRNIEIAKNAIKKSSDDNFISETTSLTIEQVQALRQS